MADFDVLVIGGGPAGYTAALRAADCGARVALVEAEQPGGACVHHACIPTNALLGAVTGHMEARELAVMGVFQLGDQVNLGRAAARKDALVKKVAEGVRTALRMRKVEVIAGRAAFSAPGSVEVVQREGTAVVGAASFVIATGTRWEAPVIPGIAPERVLTPDAVQRLPLAPDSAVLLGGGPADTAFALEYAFLLAVSGTRVTLAIPDSRFLAGLDPAVAAVARANLEGLGIRILDGSAIEGSGQERVVVGVGDEWEEVPGEVIVAGDPRRPWFEMLNLEAAGVQTDPGRITVDRQCRTSVSHIFAAGDVTGQVMLSSAAIHMGEVAGENAAGGDRRTHLLRLPHILHTMPEIGWAGMTEEAARAAGHDVRAGVVDLSFNPRAIAMGAREGLLKVVADAELGEILGVHVTGPGVSEILNVAAAFMQAESSVHDLAALVAWHPSLAEGLVEAARRAR